MAYKQFDDYMSFAELAFTSSMEKNRRALHNPSQTV